jgi:hypothetical protein
MLKIRGRSNSRSSPRRYRCRQRGFRRACRQSRSIACGIVASLDIQHASIKYSHKLYKRLYVYMLCQFENWCIPCGRVLLERIHTNASNAGVRHGTLRLATEVPISTRCPFPTRPFGGLEITAAVHTSGRDLLRSKSGAQAHLNSRLTASTRPDRACAG